MLSIKKTLPIVTTFVIPFGRKKWLNMLYYHFILWTFPFIFHRKIKNKDYNKY